LVRVAPEWANELRIDDERNMDVATAGGSDLLVRRIEAK
jgi:hypothetical protein